MRFNGVTVTVFPSSESRLASILCRYGVLEPHYDYCGGISTELDDDES